MDVSLGYSRLRIQEFIGEQQVILREEKAAFRQEENEEREYNLRL